MTKNENIKNKNIVTYAKKSFVLIKITKANIKYIIKLGIIVTTQENIGVQHIIFVI